MNPALGKASRILGKTLLRRREKLALAESCTGGLVAALLSEIPGSSNFFCGSQVVYRNDTKRRWAGVRAETIARKTAVSAEVAEELARGILRRTPEATVAASITGYLGPTGDPVGQVFVAVLRRGERRPTTIQLDLRLKPGARRRTPTEARYERRSLAAWSLLLLLQAAFED